MNYCKGRYLPKKAILVVLLLLYSGLGLMAIKLTLSEFEHEIWRLTNEQRSKYQLPRLEYEEGLADLARQHSRDMVNYGYFDHKDHQGRMVSERHKEFYPQLIVSSLGENLARFTSTEMSFSPQEIVEGWMNSPEHRVNLLDPDYTHLGVGVVTRGDKLLATQNFATAIARLHTPLPEKFKRKDNYRLEFTYLSPRPWQSLNAVLNYPNPRTKFFIDKHHFTLGSEPLKIIWLDEEHFAVDLNFSAGKGIYQLNFGFDGGYYQDGVKMRVK